MKITIRKFRKSDAIKAGNLVKRAIKLRFSKTYSKQVIDAFCRYNDPKNFIKRATDGRQLYVAETNNKIIGVIGIKKNELKTFFVHPDYQGKGIGRRLFEKFKKEAIKRGIRNVKVNSSLYACPVYKKFGFKKVRKVKKKTDDGFIYYDILMKQRLR